ncbi:MAG: RNA polymerase sigma factor [Deltaproteobacteria bacterium]|nr:RNA polymerase sigma factor [Deltaproteobacteria bacterium]
MSTRVLRPLLTLVPEDDSVLLQRVATGDVNALGVAFDRFHRDVYGVLARLRGTRVDLDDLVQTTFLALPRAAHNYDPLASARSFVIGVALQIARRERRNLVRRWKLWQARSHELDAPEGDVDPERRAGDREDFSALESALGGLSHAQREVIILHEVQGMKGEEIAQALGVPVNTVWTRLHHARNALRAALDARGGR